MTYPFTPPGSRRSSTGAATYRHAQIPLLELRRRSKTDMDGIGNHDDNAQNAPPPAHIKITENPSVNVQRPLSADSKHLSISDYQPQLLTNQIAASLDSLTDTNTPHPGADSDLSITVQSPRLSHNADNPVLSDDVLDARKAVLGVGDAVLDSISEYSHDASLEEGENLFLIAF